MSEQQSKKFRQTFNKNFKQQIQETAEKIAKEYAIHKIKKVENELFNTAKQRDWMLILNILFICVIIVEGILLFWRW